MTFDRQALGGAKALAYAIIWLAGLITLFRGGVVYLWGSRSDFGLLAAVLLGAGGIVVLVWLATVMIRDVARHFEAQDHHREEGPQ